MVNPAASAFSQLLEQLSNSVLALDIASRIKLAGIEGRCVQIKAQGAVYSLLIQDERIRIYHSDNFAWDVRIEGSITDLAQMLLNVGSPSNVQIDGDELLLEELRAIFRNLKPDIETPIARLLGEQPAQTLSALFQMGLGASRMFANSIRDAGVSKASSHAEENYLQRDEFEPFVDALYKLKLRIDRVAALIALKERDSQAAGQNQPEAEPGSTN